MYLSDHSLGQLDADYLQSLDEAALRGLSVRLLADLKEARERLHQGPHNSSRPPSSRAPWERSGVTPPAPEPAPERQSDEMASPPAKPGGDVSASGAPEAEGATEGAASDAPQAPRRRPGKQPGAPGFGRTQVLAATTTVIHRPAACDGCGAGFDPAGESVAYGGFQVIDVVCHAPERLGLEVQVTDHRYHEGHCPCGHRTRAHPGSGEVDPLFEGVTLSEWRLVGPGLAALIVALHLRCRLSRARTREFLHDWLGVSLSLGTLDRTLHEAGAALAPVEEELVTAILASDLLHSDETTWPQGRELLWLWVFTSTTTTLYYVAGRGRELLDNLLPGFTGWLMSDGWHAYRHWPRRLRCWAHLTRKAQGLIDSYDREARAFGHQVQDTFDTLMTAIYAAREGPPSDLTVAHAPLLDALHAACLRHRGHVHAKTHALAVELLSDWAAIFRVLEHPDWPLTNNAAERALRHWVIARRLMMGTRSDTGSRVFALLASVVETCRQRGHRPWPYIASVIAARRAGRDAPPLPLPVGL